MARTKTTKKRKGSPILQNLIQEMVAERGAVKTLVNPEGEISRRYHTLTESDL